MRRTALITGAAVLLASLAAVPAMARSAWQKPGTKECTLEPGEDCNVEVACPAEMPYLAAGGGGIPRIEPADHRVAITMSLPVAQDTWRVRWRNMSQEQTVTGTFAVRVKCADTAAEAGW